MGIRYGPNGAFPPWGWPPFHPHMTRTRRKGTG